MNALKAQSAVEHDLIHQVRDQEGVGELSQVPLPDLGLVAERVAPPELVRGVGGVVGVEGLQEAIRPAVDTTFPPMFTFSFLWRVSYS